MHPIEVSELTIRYGDVVAVAGISFHVSSGEIVALLGPNGAGKTTTIEALEGYRVPDSGTAEVLGHSADSRQGVAHRIGVMLQEDGLYPAAKPIDVVRLFRGLYGDVGPAPESLLDRVGLTDRAQTSIRRLSGGERRRLALALALTAAPEVLLLDEPTSGVDHDGRQTLRQVVREAAGDGAAVLLTTHELDEAQRLADRVVIIDKGQIVASGTPEALTTATASSGIRFSAEPALDLTYLVIVLGAQIVEVEPGEYHASTAPTPIALAKITAWMAERQIMLGEIRAGRHRLEDVFEQLTTPSTDTDTSSGTAGAADNTTSRRRR